MDSGLKALLLAAGTVITCIVISLAFYLTRGAKDTATSGFNQISKLTAEFNETDKALYDGLEVTGSEVLNLITKFKNEQFGIIVKTHKSTTYYGNKIINAGDTVYEMGDESPSKISDAKKIENNNYINQNAQFTGEVLRDSNNTIIGLQFTQG